MNKLWRYVIKGGAFIGALKVVDHYIPKSTNPIVGVGLVVFKLGASLICAQGISNSIDIEIETCKPKKKRASYRDYASELKKEKSLGEDISEKVRDRIKKYVEDKLFPERKETKERVERMNRMPIMRFSSEEKAREFVNNVEDIVESFGFVSIDDVNTVRGYDSLYGDERWGWKRINSSIDRCPEDGKWYVTLGAMTKLS